MILFSRTDTSNTRNFFLCTGQGRCSDRIRAGRLKFRYPASRSDSLSAPFIGFPTVLHGNKKQILFSFPFFKFQRFQSQWFTHFYILSVRAVREILVSSYFLVTLNISTGRQLDYLKRTRFFIIFRMHVPDHFSLFQRS